MVVVIVIMVVKCGDGGGDCDDDGDRDCGVTGCFLEDNECVVSMLTTP